MINFIDDTNFLHFNYDRDYDHSYSCNLFILIIFNSIPIQS